MCFLYNTFKQVSIFCTKILKRKVDLQSFFHESGWYDLDIRGAKSNKKNSELGNDQKMVHKEKFRL